MTSVSVPNDISILVVGAGPAGSVFAKLMAERGWSVTIIDRYPTQQFKIGETLQADSIRGLGVAGIDRALDGVPSLRCAGNNSIWGTPTPELRSAITNPYGGGWQIDRAAFDARLTELARNAGAKYLRRCRILRSSRCGDMWRVELRSEKGVHDCWYKWVVEASGRSSVFARSHGADRIISDRLVGVFGLLMSGEFNDPDLTISIESVPDGWWYSARLPGGKRIAIFFTDGDLLKATGARQATSWWRLLHQTTLLRQVVQVAGYTLHGEPTVMLADTSRLQHLHGAGWLAIGDAAVSRDPLSAAGISEAVCSASDAANALLQAKSSDQDSLKTYSKVLLERYSTYQRMRVRYYQVERRWLKSEFWKRRQEFVTIL